METLNKATMEEMLSTPNRCSLARDQVTWTPVWRGP
jgi:hypothetical protein